MHFRFVSILITFLVVSCGILGQRDDFKTLIEYGSENLSCIGELGDQIQAFSVGETTPQKWEETLGCASESLQLFSDIVRSSEPGGYTHRDIRLFLENYLLKERTITDELVQGGFRLKTVLVGGNDQLISQSEIKRIQELIKNFGKSTSPLIEHLKNRLVNPNFETMSDLMVEFEEAGRTFGQTFEDQTTGELSLENLSELITETKKTFHFETDKKLPALLMHIRKLLVAGSDDTLRGSNIRPLLEISGGVVGAFLALGTSVSGGKYYLRIFDEIKNLFDKVFLRHDSEIPLAYFDDILFSIPESWLEIQASNLKHSLRPLVSRLLHGETDENLRPHEIQYAHQFFADWVRSQEILDEIVQLNLFNPDYFTAFEWSAALQEWRTNQNVVTLEDQQRLERLNEFGQKLKPIVPGQSDYISFDKKTQFSTKFMEQTLWISFVGDLIIRGYGQPHVGERVTVGDMKNLFLDFQEIAFDLQFLDRTAVELWEKRFREGDLFTLSSNGDGYLDRLEISLYGSYLLSISLHSKDVRDLLQELCSCRSDDPIEPMIPACQVAGYEEPLDPLGWQWMSIDCFREEYFSRVDQIWALFPNGLNYYQGLDFAGQLSIQSGIETFARRYGISDHPIGSYDVIRYGGIMHYVESIFYRFDDDENQILNTEEILNAFPLFRKTIAEVAGIKYKEKKKLEAIFTYLVKQGEKPKTDFWGTIEFVYWMLTKPFWSIQATRQDIYQLIGIFSESEDPPTPPSP